MIRCVAEGKHVASLFADAWASANQVDLNQRESAPLQSNPAKSTNRAYGSDMALVKAGQSIL
jgi:hypothetical protein